MTSPSRSRRTGGGWSRRGAGIALPLAASLVVLLPARVSDAGNGLLAPLPVHSSEHVRHLRDYLRIDTSNPPGNETAGARFLETVLRAEGIEAEVVELAPGRGNLVARIRGNGRKPALVLNNHVDVVPAGSEKWTFPPFSAAISGGRIHARGAIDDKGPGYAQVAAFIELKRSGRKLDRDVLLLATADEESGGHLGVEGLLARRPELGQNVAGVLGEGGGNDVVVDKVQLWKLEISQKRPLWLRLVARGRAGHGAVPEPGGASHRLIRALGKLLDWKPAPRVSPLLDECLRRQSKAKLGRKKEVLADIRRALATDPREIEVLFGAGLPALFVPTVSIGKFQGSESINVIPAEARAEVDLRIRPDDDSAAVLAEIRKLVEGENVEIEVLESAPPVEASPIDSPLYRDLASFLEAEEPGSVAAPMIQQGFSDGRHFRARGIPVYGFSPFKINYYDLPGIHGVDEKIRADFFEEGVARLARFLGRFCGTAGDRPAGGR